MGRYFEARDQGKASEAISKLLEMGAKEACLLVGELRFLVPIDQVQVGDRQHAGEENLVDGEVIDGRAAVDVEGLPENSVPVGKTVGDRVAANDQPRRAITVRATVVGADTALAQIVGLVEQARPQGPQRMVDRVSAVSIRP